VPAVTDDHATLATRRPATALPGPDFHRLDRTSFAWRTHNLALMIGGTFDSRRSKQFGTFLPSRPGEFHPEPLTDSGLDTLASSGSCHRAKAAAFH